MSGPRNIVTGVTYNNPPVDWHRAEWVTVSPGHRALRYEIDYDLTTLLHNLAVAGALTKAYLDGRWDGMGEQREHLEDMLP